jgi:hypothetical protein
MRLSRRPLFFLAIAGAALLLFEPTPAELRWLNLSMAGLALFWFVLLAAEELWGQRGPGGPSVRGDDR